jgi:glycerophosphoryl diester phosphodiesterase
MATPLLIAHRGASRHAPENSLAAFELAVDFGADWIELDIQLSSDGEAVVFHDDTLDRLSSESGPLADRSVSELTEIEIRDPSGNSISGQTIPTLQTVLETVGARCPLYIELKSDGGGMSSAGNRALLDRCVELLPPENGHVLASFDVELVSAALERDLRSALIFSEMAAADHLMPAERRKLYAFSARGDLLQAGALELARGNDSFLWLWTLDDADAILQAAELGVHGVCSNDVPLARAILDS